MLHGKKIILGVTGSIAAYKSALLVRLLVKSGATVRVIMTPAAHDFITPLTLATLSKNPVLTDYVKNNAGEWNNHIELGLWADAMLIAPASANTMGKMANGICDNLLLAVYLSARCPVIIAPAMDLDMWEHPATKGNKEKLISYGHQLIEPTHGELASGLTGKGRMPEPEELHDYLVDFFSSKESLSGKKVLVTAGPTYEHIDPVRFIGNHSSGKMGFAIAEALASKGARVDLVTGPTAITVNHPRITLHRVQSAEEMYQQCIPLFADTDIAVLAAAVADYKPKVTAEHKIKKKDNSLILELVKTHDIAASLGRLKKPHQLIAGFALETQDEVDNARKKLMSKNFDFIVLNSLNDPGSGFGFDTNKITIISHTETKEFPLSSKKEAAAVIADTIEAKVHG